MIKPALFSLALGTFLATGAVHAQVPDKEKAEPTNAQYQNHVNTQQAPREDPVARDPDHPAFTLEEGGRAPNKYLREDYVIKDWQKHKLSQPGADSQWVKIGADYVLLKRSNAVIEKIVKARQ